MVVGVVGAVGIRNVRNKIEQEFGTVMAVLFFGPLLAVELMEENERRNERMSRRLIRDAQDPFCIPDAIFRANFKLNKEACLDLIYILDRHLHQGRNLNRIPNYLRVFSALNFFAVGSYQRAVGNSLLTCISQPMVSRSIKEVVNVMLRHCLKRWVHFPRNNAEREEHSQKFVVSHQMQQIIGVVDGTHVAIVTPEENKNTYVNRKGYYSINVQIICDANLKIISVIARWPGGTDDACVWRSSRVGATMRANYENGDHSSMIIGDSGYACLPWLLVPVVNPTDAREERFNNRLKRTQSTVERCIGVLKGRFRCLLKDRTLCYTPRHAGRIIMTCAILHNIAIHYGIEDPEPMWDEIDLEMSQPLDNIPVAEEVYRQLGQDCRQQYIQEYF